VALDVMLFILCVMGGRVIPMFTNNGVPGAQARRVAWLENVALLAVLALALADALQLHASVLAFAAIAAAAHLARWLLWQPWRTWRVPLVWVLHLGYAWIPVHLALRTGVALGAWPAAAAVHALTVGAIGGVVIGMLTRTARGHTGRPLRADGWEQACYLLVALAALVRVLVPVLVPSWTSIAILVAGAAWSAGFALYGIRYWHVLTRARVDGRAD